MSTTAPSSWAELVEGLVAEGVLGEQWRAAFVAVPREVFIPEVIWRDAGDDLVPLRRGDEPEEWLRRAYGSRYVVTQVDDGTPAGPDGCGRVATSSASRPDIVALMLEAGQVEPGMRVLEIGTGTGYTAALLAHRLGARNVTTIEVDPELAARARAALSTAGYGEVSVLTGDGARGHRRGAVRSGAVHRGRASGAVCVGGADPARGAGGHPVGQRLRARRAAVVDRWA